MPAIQLRNVSKVFEGETIVLTDFSLDIEEGEFLVLVGPSGCGKSTILRLIAGLEELTSGEIYIGDKMVNDLPPKNRDIAMVFQNYALYPHMTVFNNLAFGLKLSKMPKAEIETQVNEAARTLEISDLLQRMPKQLSGGQKQRVALGRAIVRKPAAFLFDEPLSNLDAKLRVQMRAEIKALHALLKTTTVYVTHDQVEAMTMGDRIVILNDGIIQQVGSPLDIYHQPKNIFVAGFIGTPPMNLLPVHLQTGDKPAIEGTDFQLPLTSLVDKLKSVAGNELTLGVRPEDIMLVDPGDKRAHFHLPAYLAEPLGNETLVHFRLPSGEFVARSTAALPSLATGQEVGVHFPEEKLHLFDRETGKALGS